jgi:thiol-disulfide isomerase/thioredoxin
MRLALGLIVLALAATPLGAGQGAGPDGSAASGALSAQVRDPLGFAWPEGGTTGAWPVRFAHLDRERDGFDYPTFVVDGIVAVEGPVQGAGSPQERTTEAYRRHVAQRATLESPLQMQVASTWTPGRMPTEEAPGVRGSVELRIAYQMREVLSGDDLHLWVALVEEPVDYTPPPAFSNGITEHPFTLRALRQVGRVDAATTAVQNTSAQFELHPGWRPERLLASVWVQQSAGFGHRYDAHEVVQATMHPILQEDATQQVEKGVLVEMLSATWCAPCLFGDRAVDALAREHQVPIRRSAAPQDAYWQAPTAWPLMLLAAAAGTAVAWPRRWNP